MHGLCLLHQLPLLVPHWSGGLECRDGVLVPRVGQVSLPQSCYRWLCPHWMWGLALVTLPLRASVCSSVCVEVTIYQACCGMECHVGGKLCRHSKEQGAEEAAWLGGPQPPPFLHDHPSIPTPTSERPWLQAPLQQPPAPFSTFRGELINPSSQNFVLN